MNVVWFLVLLVVNLALAVGIIIYWLIIKKNQKVEIHKKLIATTFHYDLHHRQFYFEVKPWFLNQKRNSLELLSRLLTRKSAQVFAQFIEQLHQAVNMNQSKLATIVISFYIQKRIEKCQVKVLNTYTLPSKVVGLLTNLYENK